jgi:hypothetical protein
MVGFFRPGLFLAATAAIALGLWVMFAGGGGGFGFPFELPEWMLVAGKDVAVGSLAILAGLAVLVIAVLTRPSQKEEEENPPSVSQLRPGD